MRYLKYLLKPYQWAGLMLAKPVIGDEFLLIKRANHPGKGTWSIPGGKIEGNDSNQSMNKFLSSAIRRSCRQQLRWPLWHRQLRQYR